MCGSCCFTCIQHAIPLLRNSFDIDMHRAKIVDPDFLESRLDESDAACGKLSASWSVGGVALLSVQACVDHSHLSPSDIQ